MKEIKGYEGLYAVTSCGQIWSYHRKKFIKPIDNGNGYLRIGLHKNGELKRYLLHRIVAEAYIPNFENKPEVNHKDEDKTHNWIGNLEWVTRKENVNYGTRNERDSDKQSRMPVYCPELDAVFNSATMAEKRTGIQHNSIIDCIAGNRKSAGKHPITGIKLTWVQYKTN